MVEQSLQQARGTLWLRVGDAFSRARDSDVWYSFTQSPLTMVAAAVTARK